jgi:hypothetical protein
VSGFDSISQSDQPNSQQQFWKLAPNGDDAQKCKSKQATMVRKCRTTIDQLPTSAQPSSATDQKTILVTHKKKNRLQPPPASRHRSILKLDRVENPTETAFCEWTWS